MKRHHRILTAIALNCAGLGAYAYYNHLPDTEMEVAEDPPMAAGRSKSLPDEAPAGDDLPVVPTAGYAPPKQMERPILRVDLNTPDLARAALPLHAAVPGVVQQDDDDLEPIIIVQEESDPEATPDAGSSEVPDAAPDEDEPPRIILPPEIILPEEVIVEMDMAREPFPIRTKPDYVQFVVGPDGETANGFIDKDRRVSIAESLLPDSPESYQLLDYRQNLHKMQDFPGFCTVISHALGAEAEYLWLPALASPPGFEAFSNAAASSTTQRLVTQGLAEAVEMPDWEIRQWVICTDRIVDGRPPFTSPQSITWLSGIHLMSDSEIAEGESTDG